MNMNKLILLFLLSTLLVHVTTANITKKKANKKTIIFIPLDERYATRGLWLNLVRLANNEYDVKTPSLEIISHRKEPANFQKLQQWVEHTISSTVVIDDDNEGNNSSTSTSFIFSFEQLIYGGLIASRTGNETLSTIMGRLEWLVSLKQKYQGIKFYCSTTVMRIPSYNGDFEEPWYWEYYGKDLFEYSFYSSRYINLKDKSDLIEANRYKSLVPSNVLDKFLWRRERNFNITFTLFHFQQKYHSMFDSLYLTLDDTGTYGFNVDEALKLKELKASLKLNDDIVRIYPGADEVESCLLSKMIVQDSLKKPNILIQWRVPNATNLIPNYENQPIIETVTDQLEACGGNVLTKKIFINDVPDIVFAVNNFANIPQLEASQQIQNPVSDYSKVFDDLTKECNNNNNNNNNKGTILALADVRYSNGGDISFVNWLQSLIGNPSRPCLLPGFFSYAAWNTDGNTLGTVAANAIILSVLLSNNNNNNNATYYNHFNEEHHSLITENKRFTLLRFLEDTYYQGIGIRNDLVNYISKTDDSVNDLSTDIQFYQDYSYKPLRFKSEMLANLLNLNFIGNDNNSHIALKSIFYPWNRTFEIGFDLYNVVDSSSTFLLSKQKMEALIVEEKVEPTISRKLLYTHRIIKKGNNNNNIQLQQAKNDNHNAIVVSCDIIIAGGSTAAFAAALAAADEGSDSIVCLLEPTSWAGGQLTSSLVTAIDFGKKNRKASCLPKLFAQYLMDEGYPNVNPGKCWVSTFCYEAKDILNKFILPSIMKRKNLKVFYQTVVSDVEIVDNTIMKINAISRTPLSDKHLHLRYSEQVNDWYSAEDSELFQKTQIQFARSTTSSSAPIVIDATENGDVLVVSSAPFVQGNEFIESGTESDDTCGQSIAYTMYLSKEQQEQKLSLFSKIQHLRRTGINNANNNNNRALQQTNFSLGKFSWSQVWSYRQVSQNTSLMAWGSQDGHGNDYPYGYHFLPVADSKSQKPWKGGLNLTTLKAAENYALEFSKWYVQQEPRLGHKNILQVDSYEDIGTLTGLSQVPYIRDTRRSIGVNSFRLNSTHLSKPAYFNDRVALGDYIYFDAHRMHDCKPLQYDGVLKPYYIPLRALTNAKYSNLLVAGKTMSQTNAANAATRLHPVEFSSGTSSGAFAAYMIQNGIETTEDVCSDCNAKSEYCKLQEIINKYQPIEWSKC